MMGARRMAAAVMAGPGRFELVQLPVPEPGPRQVRVRLEGSGLCGSNLLPFEGRPWFKYPFSPGAPGHEGWGVVDAVGEGAGPLEPGMRVAAISGQAFAEYEVVDAGSVVRLPEELRGPFPGEPLGCAMNAFRRSDVRAGQTVAVVGVGFMGALLTRLMANAGARVIAVSRRPFSLEIARRFGAHEVLPLTDLATVVGQVKELTGGELCERVVEAVGAQGPLNLAAELVRERGRLIIAGYHQDGPRQVNMWLWNWRGLDVINAHERDPAAYVEGVRQAVAEVDAGRLDPGPLYTHRFPLAEIGVAFGALRDRPEGFLKALVTV